MNPLVYIAPALVALVVLGWGVVCYNALVALRNHVRESWAGVDTELQRRWDLIPRLVEVVRGYASHESEVLTTLTELRAQAAGADDEGAEARTRREHALDGALEQLRVTVEAYPDLKADQSYLDLQRELVSTEDRIQAARRFYNANARDLNTRVEQLPSALVARLGGFDRAEYFAAEAEAREAPAVGL